MTPVRLVGGGQYTRLISGLQGAPAAASARRGAACAERAWSPARPARVHARPGRSAPRRCRAGMAAEPGGFPCPAWRPAWSDRRLTCAGSARASCAPTAAAGRHAGVESATPTDTGIPPVRTASQAPRLAPPSAKDRSHHRGDPANRVTTDTGQTRLADHLHQCGLKTTVLDSRHLSDLHTVAFMH